MVVGLGLIGLLTVQLLRAHGCRVMGVDFHPDRLALAQQFGAGTVDLSRGKTLLLLERHLRRGGVWMESLSRLPPRVVLPCTRRRRCAASAGVSCLVTCWNFLGRISTKELTFQVSCSYGPGRYDPDYEERGQDYPLGFVRWTAQRNFEAVLSMLADGPRRDVDLPSFAF